ncbi:hypothetical protein [Shewanella sp. NIFS-20-20]|uniref:hypothetical protein n=1 Tax=Shewanella sp. NIFS-20-20 TaxID=2853806 RepID=UPI001C492179|nr:hypothetical protein [Shewanella sp. NIFS-20-20]MBV7314822.1 hypothetical protein [Shewanella sp. NIFS-20-20]
MGVDLVSVGKSNKIKVTFANLHASFTIKHDEEGDALQAFYGNLIKKDKMTFFTRHKVCIARGLVLFGKKLSKTATFSLLLSSFILLSSNARNGCRLTTKRLL